MSVLFFRFRQLQVEADSKWSDLQNQLKVKQFEIDRLQMMHDETNKNLKHASLENEKYHIKNEVRLEEGEQGPVEGKYRGNDVCVWARVRAYACARTCVYMHVRACACRVIETYERIVWVPPPSP